MNSMSSIIDQSQPQQTFQGTVSHFKIGPEIGRGSFANVYKGYDINTKSPVAVKSVFRSRLKNQKLIENLEIEIRILKNLKNPHIVGLIDCIKTDQYFHLFMEYCSLGDLSYFIRKRDQLVKTHPLIRSILERYPSPKDSHGLNKILVINFIKQLASALEFLRSQNLVHRDIKPQNLLLLPPVHSKEEFNEKGYSGFWELPILKIADFGFARFLPSTSMAETLCGSPLYMAPEILRYEKYNAKADLWSVGAVIYEMAVGKPPFRAANHVELLRKIEKAKDEISFPVVAEVSEDLIRLICGLLKANPTERMGFNEFFNDPVVIYNDVKCADQPLDCSMDDDQLFISEYLPIKNNKISPAILSSSIRQPKAITQQQLQPLKNLNVPEKVIENVDEEEEERNEIPNKSAIASAVTMKAVATRQTNKIKNPGKTAESILIEQKNQKADKDNNYNNDDIGNKNDNYEKDYVVVEKRTVEVNALADELSKAGSGALAITPKNSSNNNNSNITVSNNNYLKRGYSFSKPRNSSFSGGKLPISISPSTALGKAIDYTSNRLFGVEYNNTKNKYNSKNEVDPNLKNEAKFKVNLTNDKLINSKLGPISSLSEEKVNNLEDENVINRLEILATMAHSISLFAEVKFSQLIPIPPSNESNEEIASSKEYINDNSNGDNNNINNNLPTIMVKNMCEEGIALYVKTLSILAQAMSIASEWWHENNFKNITSPKLNELVQWIRNSFNESLEKAEFLRLKLSDAINNNENMKSVNSKPLIAEKLIFDRAIEVSRIAAIKELKNEDLIGCELNYSTAIWMLEAILNGVDDKKSGTYKELDQEDSKTVQIFINSIGNRLKVLRQKIDDRTN